MLLVVKALVTIDMSVSLPETDTSLIVALSHNKYLLLICD